MHPFRTDDEIFAMSHTASSSRDSYKLGRTLGAGTYGIVREAEQNGQKYAIKIILKKNVKGNEKMVYDELEMLQRMKHPHIVRFHDWFESRVRFLTSLKLLEQGALTRGWLGQILHRHAAGDRRRAVRPDMRVRQVHREGRLADDPPGPRGRRLPTLQQRRAPR